MTTTEQPSNGLPVETAADDSSRCRSAFSDSIVREMQQDERGGRACIAYIVAAVLLLPVVVIIGALL